MEKRGIREVLKKALNSGADFAELFWEQKEIVMVNCEENRIERINSGFDEGVGIRVMAGENTSYAFTNDLSFTRLLEVAETAGKGAQKKQDLLEIKDFYTPPSPLKLEIKKPPQEIEIEKKVQTVLEVNDAARQVDQRIRQVTVNYGDVRQKVTIANSDGVFVEDLRTRTRLSVHTVAAEGNLIQTGYHSLGGSQGFELLEENDPTQIAEIASQRAILMLSAKPAPSGKMPVVLAGKAGGTMVHEACGHGLEADLVQKGLSVYAGKKGQEVASPLITVVDDGLLSGKFGTTCYDDEGTPCEKNILIKQGVLENYMYDLRTAKQEGGKSTGNGRRESYQSRPLPRMRNTYIAPGKTDPEKIIKETKEGLLVTAMGGGQVNTLNGDYVFEVAEAYVIKDGEAIYPVRGATLTGNGPETLRLVELVGKDLGFTIGICGKEGQGVPVSDAQPTMAVRELVVGGTGGEFISEDKKIRRL
ncbi:MAG: TldD/PmbA family protein [Clostridia bacterium]|nr:TldD/PmbA family protein [Clostridia bacterium]